MRDRDKRDRDLANLSSVVRRQRVNMINRLTETVKRAGMAWQSRAGMVGKRIYVNVRISVCVCVCIACLLLYIYVRVYSLLFKYLKTIYIYVQLYRIRSEERIIRRPSLKRMLYYTKKCKNRRIQAFIHDDIIRETRIRKMRACLNALHSENVSFSLSRQTENAYTTSWVVHDLCNATTPVAARYITKVYIG